MIIAVVSMSRVEVKTTLFQGINVTYYNYSAGPKALVFIHGWTCSSLLWSSQEELLLHRYRSLLIDLPGHGKSDTPKIEYSQEQFARAVKAVLHNAGVGKAVLVGHSMGGPVSTMFLRLFPDLVSGIVYVDSFFHSPENYLSGVERRELAEKLRCDGHFESLISSFWTARSTPQIKAAVLQAMMSTERHVRVKAVTTDSLPHAFKGDEVFEIPALLIATPQRAQVDFLFLHHIPKLKTVTWEGNGHFLFMEEPERFCDAVDNFVVEHGLLCKE